MNGHTSVLDVEVDLTIGPEVNLGAIAVVQNLCVR
jgi:hypothetical protein